MGSLWNLHLINTDPHPGNYLFHLDGTVTFLDFGCVKRMTEEQVRLFSGWWRPTMDNDQAQLFRAAVESGFVDPADPPDPGGLLAWWTAAYRYMLGPQPFTITPEYVAAVLRDRISSTSPHREVARKMTMNGELTMALRMDTGMIAALGGLRAAGQWRAICEEWVTAAPPATPYGQLDAEYRAAHR